MNRARKANLVSNSNNNRFSRKKRWEGKKNSHKIHASTPFMFHRQTSRFENNQCTVGKTFRVR